MSLGQNINLLKIDYSIKDKLTFTNNPDTYFNDNNIFPSTSFLKNDKDKINIMLNNTILKRACCMRKNNNDDTNTIVLQYIDDKDNEIENSFVINDLNKYCNNLEYIDDNGGIVIGNFIPQTNSCDNFYKTYCKTLSSYNQDNKKDINEYRNLIKYSYINDKTTGLECSCINSPILNTFSNDSNFSESTIFWQDRYCSNNGSYLTNVMKNSTEKSITLNSCNNIIGSNNQANGGNYSEIFNDKIITNCAIINNKSTETTKDNNTSTETTKDNNTSKEKSNNILTTDTKDTSSTDKTIIFLGLNQNELIGLFVIIFIIIAIVIYFKRKNI